MAWDKGLGEEREAEGGIGDADGDGSSDVLSNQILEGGFTGVYGHGSCRPMALMGALRVVGMEVPTVYTGAGRYSILALTSIAVRALRL